MFVVYIKDGGKTYNLEISLVDLRIIFTRNKLLIFIVYVLK